MTCGYQNGTESTEKARPAMPRAPGSDDEERLLQCAQALDNPRAAEAKMAILGRYDQLLRSMARHAVGRASGDDSEDALQDMNATALNAIAGFRVGSDARFSTYLYEALLNTAAQIGRKSSLQLQRADWKLVTRLREARESLRHGRGKEPSVLELARAGQMPESEVQRAQLLEVVARPVSLDAAGLQDQAEQTALRGDDFTRKVVEKVDSESLLQAMARVLLPKEYHVMELRYGGLMRGGEILSLEEVARKLGMERDDLYQLELSIIEKLQGQGIVPTPHPFVSTGAGG